MKTLIVTGILIGSLALFSGCGDATTSSSATPVPDYRAEAERNISADNMDSTLQQLEAEIQADLEAEVSGQN